MQDSNTVKPTFIKWALSVFGIYAIFWMAYQLCAVEIDRSHPSWLYCVYFTLATISFLLFCHKVVFNKWPSVSVSDLIKIPIEFIIGLLIGVVQLFLSFVVMYLCGARFDISPSGTFSSQIIIYLFRYFYVAIVEEAIYRGLIFPIVSRRYGVIIAAITSSIMFGMLHLFNNGITWLSFISTVIWGFEVCIAYCIFNNLAISSGIHLGWNVTIGLLCGMNLSGFSIPCSYFITNISGPDIIIGRDFGPEESIIMIPMTVIFSVALFFICKKTNRANLLNK